GTGSPNEPRKSRCTSCPATPPNSTPSKSSTPTSKPTSPQGQALEPRQNWRTAHAPTCAAARTNPTVSKPSSAKHPCSTPQTDTPQLPYGSISAPDLSSGAEGLTAEGVIGARSRLREDEGMTCMLALPSVTSAIGASRSGEWFSTAVVEPVGRNNS